MRLSIDIETYCEGDLLSGGVYKYAQHPSLEVLMVAFQFENESDPHILDLGRINHEGPDMDDIEQVETFVSLLKDPGITKVAWNALFERTVLSRFFNIDLQPEQWHCAMAHAAHVGLPLSLDQAAKALGVDQKKDAAGKRLIKYFSVPCAPTALNGGRTRNLPHHDPARWEEFKAYCVQDVRVEKAISDQLAYYKFPERERKVWCLDQQINDRGIRLDPVLVKNAIAMDTEVKSRLEQRAKDLTGLDNPNSTIQLKSYLQKHIANVDTLRKEDIPALLEATDIKEVKEVLRIRQMLSKSSIKKYEAMHACIGEGDRARGLLQYYGANRTGRWAGRLVQVQNLPQNHLKPLDLARQLVREGDLEMVEMLFDSVPDVLSQLVRTAFIPEEHHRFIVSDFAAIEARVIAWLAGEKWRMDVFGTHGKIYEASASQMFKIPLDQVDKKLRQKGKIAELALGYQGGVNAMIKMGALKMGLAEEELQGIVTRWRKANPSICALWDEMNNMAIEAIGNGTTIKGKHISMRYQHGNLWITLPSGRDLCYLKAGLRPSKYGNMEVVYMGLDQETKQFNRQSTYGGKLVENIVQATSRDILATAMLRLRERGYRIVMHVHDEVVMEVPIGEGSIEEVNGIMGHPIRWAEGLLLKAESFECLYYQKD